MFVSVLRRTCSPVSSAVALATVAVVLAVLFPVGAADARVPLEAPEGFGAMTTGGNGAPVIWVTSLADSGAGTLRDAVERTEPAEVRFAVTGTIDLRDHVMVGPDKTIDGRDAYVTITRRGLVLVEPNVIVESLRFNRFGDTTVTDDPEDAIEIRGAERVWISHNEFSGAADKAIQVTSGTDITVSGNRFVKQAQVFQIGCFACPDSAEMRVSVHGNWFQGGDKGYRMPTVNYGYVHAWNNYVQRWANFAMASNRVGSLFSQANVFEAGDWKRAVIFDNPAPEDKDPRYGYVRSVGDLTLNGAEIYENQPEEVVDPGYVAVVAPGSTSLKRGVVATAGPRRF